MRIALHEFYEGAVSLMVAKTAASGKGMMNAFYTFEPNTVYITHDPIVKQWALGEIPGAEVKSIMSQELKDALEHYEVKYKTVTCGSCVGARPHYLYNPFTVLEESDD